MRKLTRKQILARLFVGFFTLGSLLCIVNSAVADGSVGNIVEIKDNSDCQDSLISGANYSFGTVASNAVYIINSTIKNASRGIFGGRHSSADGLAASNTVKIEESNVTGSVYGGYVKGSGSATQNKVAIPAAL